MTLMATDLRYKLTILTLLITMLDYACERSMEGYLKP